MDFHVLRDLDFDHTDGHATVVAVVPIPAIRHMHSVLAAVLRTCMRLRYFDMRHVDIHSTYATTVGSCANCGKSGSEILAWYKSLEAIFHFDAGDSVCHHISQDAPLERLTITAAYMPDDDPVEAIIRETMVTELVNIIEATLREELKRPVATHHQPA